MISGRFEPFEGALVDDHLEEPGHAGGLVRLAVGEQAPFLVDVASRQDTRRDLPEVAFRLDQVRDEQEAVDLGERGLGFDQEHVPGGGAHPRGMRGEPGRRGCRSPGHVDDRVGSPGFAHAVLGENAGNLVRAGRREPGLQAGQPVGFAAQPGRGLVVGQARDLPGRLEHRPELPGQDAGLPVRLDHRVIVDR
jgi:hypothetical protein